MHELSGSFYDVFIVALVGAVIGALLPVKEEKLVSGFIPIRIFNAIGTAGLFCFLYFVGGGVNPDSY